MRIIDILGFENAQLLDITGPFQVFATANDELRLLGKPPAYQLRLVAKTGQVITNSGLALASQELPKADQAIDTLMIAGGRGVNAACCDEDILAWIRTRAAHARRVCSVCSGAFLLAEVGLLDGRKAVTHWNRCAEFSERFPQVKLDPDPIFLQDGHIWTSAGVTAGIDLALALVEADLGRSLALAVARELVVFLKRPGGQSQFSTMLALQQGSDRFDALHSWILDNLRRDLSVETLASHVHMSTRSFCRHYLKFTGRTPARAVEEIRVETARRLLEQGVSVAQTRLRCGFGADETMRRSFLRILSTTPQAYRERF
ncbi:GlxA family transcriptional regulator [Agrobacterium vitis]|uniref:Helix-turn-helix domain-containing protein n=1 Tax=Agrobacterium vitis TaxID=373 RepID=A0A7K1RI35_AGRVI|nr:helix-turn-helix domain-containing protein [Agrobacterium vitis]MVA57684.1 helix-turn-helix domain-containing protein [Agrobacterium vitis]